MPYYRKSTRLPVAYYVGTRTHFITICCGLRRCHLADPKIAEAVRDLLLVSGTRHNFLIHAYCLTPDHIHFLAQGVRPDSDLREFVRNFKLRTAYGFSTGSGRRLWEKSYYDHILRSAESLE